MLYAAVTGAGGRMGTTIIKGIKESDSITLTGALEREDSVSLGKDAGEAAGCGALGVEVTADRGKAFKDAEVIIDFTHPDASLRTLEDAVTAGKAVVLGTTGFSHTQREKVRELGGKTRLVMAPNMSVGVNLLWKVVADIAPVLGADYDIEIIESHHRHKKDAPSGTALRIAEVAAASLDRDLEKVAVYERKGIVGERSREEIGIQSIRAGDIVGDHTILFAGPGERLEVTHKASSRETFAHGALVAALWVRSRPRGLYDMQDVLGLKN
ncbi:MAG: 4-hydroxy-tetrahydrodipicolinate reductase [Thermodesulfobacteriota bacterium]